MEIIQNYFTSITFSVNKRAAIDQLYTCSHKFSPVQLFYQRVARGSNTDDETVYVYGPTRGSVVHVWCLRGAVALVAYSNHRLVDCFDSNNTQ